MKMKYIMKEKGLVDNATQVIACPSCEASSLFQDGKVEMPLFHDEKCLFVQTCHHLKVNPHDLDDERVMRVLEIKNLFDGE